ncbi:MAG: acyl-CoA thioesterase [Thermoplasmatota archaeon]
MTAWPFSVEVPVRFRDCDPMGHLNNAVVATFLEIARTDYWMKKRGLATLSAFDIIVARVEIDFVSQSAYGETLVVRCGIERIGETSFVLAYEIADKATGRLVARAKTVQVYFDYEKNAKRAIPTELRAALELDLVGR